MLLVIRQPVIATGKQFLKPLKLDESLDLCSWVVLYLCCAASLSVERFSTLDMSCLVAWAINRSQCQNDEPIHPPIQEWVFLVMRPPLGGRNTAGGREGAVSCPAHSEKQLTKVPPVHLLQSLERELRVQ